MFYYNLLFIFFAVISSVNSALNNEEIVGGYSAYLQNYRYHAAIMAMYNNSGDRYLVCSACIVGEFHVLSAYMCFFHKSNGELKRQSFFVLVNSTHLTANSPEEREIKEIYTAGFTYDLDGAALAVSKLKEGLGLANNPYLVSLPIYGSDTIDARTGVVTGYGTKTNKRSVNSPSVAQIRITRPGLDLTYASVTVMYDDICEKEHRTNKEIHICGIILPDWKFQDRGICIGDIGAPLVIQEQLVGIAIKKNPDCNDNIKGSVYARVSYYKTFIDGVVSGSWRGTNVFPFITENRPHIHDDLE